MIKNAGLEEVAQLACVSLVLTAVAVPLFRAAAWRWGWLDWPTARSLHKTVTPRGGGVAMMAAAAVCLVLTWPLWWERRGPTQAVLGAIVLGIVGFCDDRLRLPPTLRFAFQLAAAAGVVVVADAGLERAPLPPPLDVPLGYWGTFVAILWIMAVVNFYNFLDGIDGLAALQGVVTGLGIALAGWDSFASSLGAALAGASAGFLVFNWSPARIFMGDVGSGLLGFSFASAPLLAPPSSRAQALLFTAVSLWLFLADATWTLLRRLARGERLHEAHRQHIYQKLVISGWTHARVAALIGAGSAILTTVALLGWQRNGWGWASIVLALACFVAEVRLASRLMRRPADGAGP